jgi:hypothetical protein
MARAGGAALTLVAATSNGRLVQAAANRIWRKMTVSMTKILREEFIWCERTIMPYSSASMIRHGNAWGR